MADKKGDARSPFSAAPGCARRKPSRLGRRLRDAVAPLARSRSVSGVLGAALVADSGRDGGNTDFPVAAGQRRAGAINLAVVALVRAHVFGQFGRRISHYVTSFPWW